MLLLVPVGRITLTYPDQVVLQVSCAPGRPLQYSMYQQHHCTPLSPNPFATDVKVEACGFACHAVLSQNDSEVVLNAKQYGIQLYNIDDNKTRTFQYMLSDADIHVPLVISETKNHKTLKNNERYKTAIRKVSENAYFFPTYSMFNFACNVSDRYECLFGYKSEIVNFQKRLNEPLRYEIAAKETSDDDEAENRLTFDVKTVGTEGLSTQCLQGFAQSREHVSVVLPLESKHLDLGSCAPRCIATAPRSGLCSNANKVVELDMRLTFWSYLSVRVFIGIVSGTSFAMFEGAVIAILREHKADYGLQRIYATIGGMISSPLSGWLIDFASKGKGYTDFRYLIAIRLFSKHIVSRNFNFIRAT